MAAPKSAARKALVVAGLTAATYFGALLILVLLPPEAAFISSRLVLAAVAVIGAPLSATVGFLIWRWSQLAAGDLAYKDDMTGLPNRRAFMVTAGRLMKDVKAGAVALMLLDIDRLKDLNDACGHQAGDELIRMAAEHLEKAAVRNGQVFRVGGDEFAILVSRERGGRLALVVRGISVVDGRFRACGHLHSLSMSLGYASCTDGENFESLFRRADRRLYEVKDRVPHRLAATKGGHWPHLTAVPVAPPPDDVEAAPPEITRLRPHETTGKAV